MKDASFWKLIDDTRGQDDPLEALRAALEQLEVAELADFQWHLGRSFEEAYRLDLWAAATITANLFCSDDSFEYFIGWLIFEGRAVYDAALVNPDSLAEVALFGAGDEMFLRLAQEVFDPTCERELQEAPRSQDTLGPSSTIDSKPFVDMTWFEPMSAMNLEKAREVFPRLFAWRTANGLD